LKIKFIYTILYFALVNLCSCAQSKPTTIDQKIKDFPKSDSNFSFIKLIPGNFTYLDIDVLDNLYIINTNNQLKKINAKGDSAGIFNDVKKYGTPSLLDVSNPLKILLYYKSFSTVVVLDRFLSFRNSINFRNKNIFKVKSLATSYDNNIWLFDEQDFKLKKINDDGSVLSETNDWRQIFDETPIPTEIHDFNGFVYLYDVQKGFYIFDYYGSLKTKLPFLQWEHIAITNNKILGFVDNTLQIYEMNTLSLKTYKLPIFLNNYTNIKAMNGKIYLLKKEGIEIYKIN
jgi:hypothetical protein